MSGKSRFISALSVFLIVALPVWAASMPSNVKLGETAKGKVFTDEHGMTLYTFKKDVAGSGKSACYDKCAKAWPPLTTSGGFTAEGGWSEITRKGGGKQLAYHGKPLYTFVKDKKPGDIAGDDFKHAWKLAQP
jgi:predicted lipoprotein with Yx(FWY)xxD motif